MFALSALALTAAKSPAHAQSADLVLCDRLAADPTDPDKPADVKGVADIAPSNVATAIKFCKIAAPASRRALFQLGRAYAANGQMAEAIAAYRKAIDKGSSAAMVELGILYAAGSGVAKDEAQARKLFERAAAAGNPRGVTRLTALSGGGAAGPPADPAEARAMLMKAAEANSAEAQYQLGVMYAEGTGGPKDNVAARAMFEKAAAQNHAEALDWLGNFALSGRGGPQDTKAAKGYYEQAAALGNEDAKAALKRLECSTIIKDRRGNFVGRSVLGGSAPLRLHRAVAVDRVDPQHGLRLLHRRDVEIDGDGLAVAAHQHAFQHLVGAGIDLLMRHIGRDEDEIAGVGLGGELQMLAPAHARLAAHHIDDAFEMAVMMRAGLGIGLDRHRAGPQFLRAGAGKIDRGLAIHARRRRHIGIELIARNDAHAVMLPAFCGGMGRHIVRLGHGQ